MSVRPVGTDPVQTRAAERLAAEILDLDTAILSFIIMNKAGEVLVLRRSSRLPVDDYAAEDMVKRFGVQTSLVLSAALNASNVMGKTEYIIGSFSKFKVLIVHIPEYELTLAVRLTTSSSGEFVYQKIRDTLGTT